MSDQCRSCMSQSFTYFDMTSSFVGKCTFLEFFNEIMRLEMDEVDQQLPKTMCKKCAEHLQGTYDFIEGARYAHEVFRQNIMFGKVELVATNTTIMVDDVEECVVEELLEGDEDCMEVMEVETLGTNSQTFEEALHEDLEYLEEIPESDSPFDINATKGLCDDDEDDDVYLKEYDESDEPTNAHKWRCTQCKIVLSGSVSYEGHMNWHRNLRPYKCAHCTKTFRCKIRRQQHCETGHATKAEDLPLWNCEECVKGFAEDTELKTHVYVVHATLPPAITCPYCSNSTELDRHNVREHLLTKHPEQYLRHFHDPVEQDEHVVVMYSCNLCNAAFSTDNLLQEHRNTHSGASSNVCQYCANHFANASSLRTHVESMHGKELEVGTEFLEHCELCNKQIFAENMKEHMQTHRRKEPNRFLCAYCPQEFPKRKCLNQHEKCHKNETVDLVFICSDCDRQYPTENQLRQHRKLAHKEREHVCPICGNAFKLKNQLMNHMKLHLEKNIQCPQCDKKYSRRFDLDVHMRSHTGEQPYACHLCSSRFSIKVRLTYHLQKHYGVKHKCKECGAEFNSRQKLKTHSFKHTGMPYRCEMCDDHGFAIRDVFKRHLLRMHSMTMSEEALTEMFQRNTGKSTRIQRIDKAIL